MEKKTSLVSRGGGGGGGGDFSLWMTLTKIVGKHLLKL